MIGLCVVSQLEFLLPTRSSQSQVFGGEAKATFAHGRHHLLPGDFV